MDEINVGWHMPYPRTWIFSPLLKKAQQAAPHELIQNQIQDQRSVTAAVTGFLMA
jgi:hypothetical protein